MSERFARVVVMLDAISENRVAIGTAARLAAWAKAPLHGVFVNDDALVRLARLPFVKVTSVGWGSAPLTAAEVGAELRAAAEQARKQLAEAAKRHAVRHSFEVVSGEPGDVLARATGRDLVVACAQTRPIAGAFPAGPRGLGAIEALPNPVLLARRAWAVDGAVVILLHDDSAGSARLVAAAAEIAEANGGALRVICPAALAGSSGFATWLEGLVAPFSVRLELEVAPDAIAVLEARVIELDCRLLAIEAGAAQRLHDFIDRMLCDLLIVR